MKTKDYEKFSIKSYNRNLNRNHINELKEKFATIGYKDYLPILVNEDFEIIDGQHRFVACKESGLPIVYQVIHENDGLLIDLNTTQKNWVLEDYVNYFAKKENNQNYIRLQNLCKELGISPRAAFSCLGSTGGPTSTAVKSGSLKFSLEDLLKVRGFMTHYNGFLSVVRIKPTTRLAEAISRISQARNFKWETLLKKAKNYPTLVYPCRTLDEYCVMLRDLYNFNTRKAESKIE